MSDSPRIQVLSDHIANKIAAGEVVDRPASVVKELMENALDAGARQITVEVVDGGRKLIAVSDDGHGMSRDDALLAIERHATSKIRDVDDIERVGTLGFRGEALPSIASVSRFLLSTRSADDEAGTEIQIAGGKIQDVRDIGRPVGTTFKIRGLFFNVPARRKFLRAPQTELSHVRQVFLLYALAYPETGMRLVVDERDVYVLAAGAQLDERLSEIYNPGFVDTLRPVQHQRHGITLTGYTGLPQATRADRSDQYVFVNHRPAAAAVIASGINEGYHTLIPRGRHPVLFLFITLDPGQVDVNVHPTKKEIRFRKPSDVRDAVIHAIREAVAQGAEPAAPEPGGAAPALPADQPALRIDDLPEVRSFRYPKIALVPEGEPPPEPRPAGTPAPVEGEASPGPEGAPWAWCRIVGQVGGLYVVLETEDGVVIMDPHAAHERVLFEKFMGLVLNHEVKGQGLLVPETVDLSPRDALNARKNLDALKAMGFGISEFGGDTFMVDALPVCLGNVSAASVLPDVAASLEASGERGGTERWAEERIAKSACRAAVKANDKLTLDEIERLVIDLARAEMPYTCPHGRPTLIFTGYRELDRKFGREQ